LRITHYVKIIMDMMLHAELTVEETLEQWPETAVVFNDYNMACIGCVIAPFCTLAAAANDYGIAEDELLANLQRAINHAD
jgi:hybrid cluster-associated redox disulfide protein